MKIALVLILIGLVLIPFGPLFAIASLNTLFGLGIAYTMKTWLAAAFLMFLISVKIGK